MNEIPEVSSGESRRGAYGSRWLAATFSLVLLLGATRVTFIVSTTETGWEVFQAQWTAGVRDLVRVHRTPIHAMEHSQQANFWLAEVNRIVEQNGADAELLMGAALVLDSPAMPSISNAMSVSPGTPQPKGEVGSPMLSVSEFEAACSTRCLQLAAQASDADPADTRWWRLRALLQTHGDTLAPRDGNWLDVLGECAKRDPENALYDYMAALYFWNISSEYDRVAGLPVDVVPRLVVNDAALFHRGTECFDKGQSKAYLAIGEAAVPAVTTFLSESEISKLEQMEVAKSRLVYQRHSILLSGLWTCLTAQAELVAQAGDQVRRSELRARMTQLRRQASSPMERSAKRVLVKYDVLQHEINAGIVDLFSRDPNAVRELNIDAFYATQRELESHLRSLEVALGHSGEMGQRSPRPFSCLSDFYAVPLVAAQWLFFVFGVTAIASRGCNSTQMHRESFGWVRHATALVVGYGVTFFIFGMLPAAVISHQLQEAMLVALVFSAVLFVLAIVAIRMNSLPKRRRVQFRLSALFVATVAVAIAVSQWSVIVFVFAPFAGHQSNYWMPTKGWGGLDATTLRISLRVAEGSWTWAIDQWCAYGGVHWGIAASLLIIVIWYRYRSSKFDKSNRPDGWQWRNCRCLLSVVRDSALLAALFWLSLHLLIVPNLLREAEQEFQNAIADVGSPLEWASEVFNTVRIEESAIARIEAEMQDFLAAIDGKLAAQDS